MNRPTRWVTDHDANHSRWYIERFRSLAAGGADLAGEARLVDAMLPRNSRVLDAGCGPGRVGAELAHRGHTVVGVDADAALIVAAVADHPGPTWLVADLSELNLLESPTMPIGQSDTTEPTSSSHSSSHGPSSDGGERALFDAAVMAGNVLPFVAPGTEPLVLARLADHLRSDGFLILGFGLERGYSLAQLAEHATAAGFIVEQQFATWDLRPITPESDFAVTVLRKP